MLWLYHVLQLPTRFVKIIFQIFSIAVNSSIFSPFILKYRKNHYLFILDSCHFQMIQVMIQVLFLEKTDLNVLSEHSPVDTYIVKDFWKMSCKENVISGS